MYRSLFENIVLSLDNRPGKVLEFMKSWTIRIVPLAQTNPKFFEHIVSTSGEKINPNMPSGVTGKFVMDLYLHDSDNEFLFLENSNRIQHEICHALLIGTPYFVKGVHDKISAGGAILSGFKIKFWTNRWKFWKYLQITIIDIRKHIV